MAIELASTYISVGLSADGLGKQVNKAFGQAGSDASTSFGKSFDPGKKGGVAKKFGTLAKVGVGAFAAIGAAAGGMALKGGLDRAMNIQGAQAKLKGLGHDAKSVDTIMSNALASVKGTAFGLGSAATTAAGAVAAGIKPGAQLEKVLKSVANSAAASGSSMDEMGGIYNKVASVGKAQNDVLSQVADRGIPIYAALADELGTTSEAVFKMASDGKIDFETFESAMTKASGTVAMEMGNTIPGKIDNAKAALSRLGESAVKGFLPMISDGISGVTELFDSLAPAAERGGEVAADAFRRVGDAFDVIKRGFDGVELAGDPMGLHAFGEGIRTYVVEPVQVGVDQVKAILRGISGKTLVKDLGNPFHELGEKAREGFGRVLEVAKGVLEGVREYFAGMVDGLGGFDKIIQWAQDLLPMVMGPIGIIRDALIETFSGKSIDMGALGRIVGETLGPVLDMAAELAGVLQTVVADAFAKLLPPIMDLFGAVGPLVGKLATGLAPVVSNLVQSILPPLQEIIGKVADVFGMLVEKITPVISVLVEKLTPVVSNIVEAVIPPLQRAFEMVAGVISDLMPVIEWLADSLSTILGAAIEALAPIVETIFGFIASTIDNALRVIQGIIDVVMGAITGDWSRVWDGIKGIAGAVWGQIKSVVSTAINLVKELISGAMGIISSIWSSAWDGITSWASTTWGNIKKLVSDGVSAIKSTVDTIMQSLSGIWSDAWEGIKGAGKAAWEWISGTATEAFEGMRTAIEKTVENLKSGIDRIWQGIKGVFREPINAVINFVNDPLIKGINDLLHLFGMGDKKIPTLTPIRAAMGGTVQRSFGPGMHVAMASGGVLAGYTPGRDVHHFVNPRTGQRLSLSGGEAIMRPEWVRQVGGPKAIRYMNDAARKRIATDYDGARFAAGGVFWPAGSKRISGNYRGHTGVDIAGPIGTPIYAPTRGVITHAGWGRGFGYSIRMALANGLQAVFGHLLPGSLRVRNGQQVMAGQHIAGMDDTGNSTGSHLHFEVTSAGALGGAANRPGTMKFLQGADIASAVGGDGGSGSFMGDVVGELFDKFTAPLKKFIAMTGDSIPAQLVQGFANKTLDNAKAWLQGLFGASAGPSGGGSSQWDSVILQALRIVGQPASMLGSTRRRLTQESSGNPRAINTWDSNARKGIPSKGLMQVIDPTFRAYRDKSLPNDIWNPLANIVASMRYALSRYGSLPAAYDKPGGYFAGTTSAAPGWAWVGERGPELVRFRGGERVLSHQDSIRAAQGGQHVQVDINLVDERLRHLMRMEVKSMIREGMVAAA